MILLLLRAGDSGVRLLACLVVLSAAVRFYHEEQIRRKKEFACALYGTADGNKKQKKDN
jgi:hypothetical protein